MDDEFSHELMFLDAVGTAEIARDMLVYAQRDAVKLADLARNLNGRIFLDNDPYWHSFELAMQVAEFEQKIKTMLEKLDPMLANSVVHQRAILNIQFS